MNPEVGDLVLTAIEAALEYEGEARLETIGKRKGLLPGGRATPAKTQALNQCLDPELGLFTVREVEEGKGKTTSKVHFVAVTRRGLELILLRRPSAERRELLDRCANPYREAAQEALLQVTGQELKQLDSQRDALEQRAIDLRQLVKQIAADQLAALDRAKQALERQYGELQQLANGAGTSPSEPKLPPRARSQQPSPVSEEDIEFQQHLCRELVFAWQDSADPEVRSALEPAMLNAGLERVGEIGETVSFDNRDHRTDHDLLPGQPAVVVEPGWQLVSPRGTLLIAPIQVTAAANAGEIVHASHAQH